MTFLAPRLGFAITITSRPIRKTPIIREIGPELSLLFLWYVLVFRRMYVELSRVESSERLVRCDAAGQDPEESCIGSRTA